MCDGLLNTCFTFHIPNLTTTKVPRSMSHSQASSRGHSKEPTIIRSYTLCKDEVATESGTCTLTIFCQKK